jgi:DNA mismatch repair ATPase MutS
MAGLPERVCQIAAEKSEALENADQKLVRDRRTAQLHSLVSQLSQAEPANTTQVIQLAKKLVH